MELFHQLTGSYGLPSFPNTTPLASLMGVVVFAGPDSTAPAVVDCCDWLFGSGSLESPAIVAHQPYVHDPFRAAKIPGMV